MEGVKGASSSSPFYPRPIARRTTMSFKLSKLRQLTSVGEIAGFLAAWMVGLWVATQASLEGDRVSPPSNLAAADVSPAASSIK